ncbi:hypothetical protein F4678DRAFT_335091 [Xylaria arbuscula]|nr:hypothetical protein F4678DRAFT_335091 [Xylaria arbuscula]
MFSRITRFIAFVAAVPCAVVLAKPEQIRGVTDPIFHFYLQAYPQNSTIPVMGPEASSEYFNIANGAIQSANSSAYLIVGSDTTSYKTLSLSSSSSSAAENTTAPGWALEGDTIITTTTSTWGRQLNFLVCQVGSGSNYWQVYLQTGSDVPTGKTCSNYQSLHLPCLC